MPSQIEIPDCQVCGKEPGVGVAASSLGPMSLSYGRKCLEVGAEPQWAIEFVLDSCGGLENTDEWFRDVRVPYGEGYITAAEFAKTYQWKPLITPEQEAAMNAEEDRAKEFGDKE